MRTLVSTEAGALARSIAETRLRDLERLHREAVLSYALRRAGDTEEARKAVEETFHIASRRLREIPIDGRARIWFYEVAGRVLSRRVGSGLPAYSTAAHRRIGGLNAEDHELLLLVCAERMSPAEAGTVLGFSAFAARRRLRRARRRLRAWPAT